MRMRMCSFVIRGVNKEQRARKRTLFPAHQIDIGATRSKASPIHLVNAVGTNTRVQMQR
jgi:hypothetical protein